MDSKKAEALLKKYWEGKVDQNEEMELKNYFSVSTDLDELPSDYFNYLKEKRLQNPLTDDFDEEVLKIIGQNKNEPRPKVFAIKYWYIAASLVLIFSLSIIFRNSIFKVDDQPQVVQTDTFEDPEKAFEETKRALLFISARLNQSSEYAAEFSKFEQNQNHLKQN